jgi:hypothetical protein
MDRVRFGRALGYGARHAVKTLVTAVDAATAEDPSRKAAGQAAETPARPRIQTPPRAAAKVVGAAARTTAQARATKQGVGRGSRRFGEAVWGPFVRLSGVLWLEITGVFFGIFALFGLGAMWKLRGDWHSTATNVENHRSLLGALAMLVVFGYFCVSNFVRARRRERGR